MGALNRELRRGRGERGGGLRRRGGGSGGAKRRKGGGELWDNGQGTADEVRTPLTTLLERMTSEYRTPSHSAGGRSVAREGMEGGSGGGAWHGGMGVGGGGWEGEGAKLVSKEEICNKWRVDPTVACIGLM